MKPNIHHDGFTLLEVLIAMLVLTIGILSVFIMQITGIRGNAKANNLTGASVRALDQIEQILSWDSHDVRLADNNNVNFTGVAGADVADNSVVVDNYTIYWDGTARMDPVNAAQQVGLDLQVHVVWNDAGTLKQVNMNITKPI